MDAHHRHEEELEWIKAKLADLEDHSRRNDLKIRGIPETIKPTALKYYFIKLMSDILPEAPATKLIIDHIHRLPKPPHLSNKFPRYTIVRIQFYLIKVRLILATRNIASIPKQYYGFSFFSDLSKYTLLQRKDLAIIIKPLRNHNIPYKWEHPVKLAITKDGKEHIIHSLKEGLALLQCWNVLEPQTSHPQIVSTITATGMLSTCQLK